MALGAIANKDWHVKSLNRRILLQRVCSKSSSFHCLEASLRHSNLCQVVEADLLERAQNRGNLHMDWALSLLIALNGNPHQAIGAWGPELSSVCLRSL